MGNSRTENQKTFGELCETVSNMMFNSWRSPIPTELVLDFYPHGSVKNIEKSRRSTINAVEISTIKMGIPLHVCIGTFRASDSHTIKFQKHLTIWTKDH